MSHGRWPNLKSVLMFQLRDCIQASLSEWISTTKLSSKVRKLFQLSNVSAIVINANI